MIATMLNSPAIYMARPLISVWLVFQGVLKEFQDEADWLKFGYHASHQGIEQTLALDGKQFAAAFTRVSQEIDRFAGDASRSRKLRLAYFFAKKEWMATIIQMQTEVLFAPDSGKRIAYALSEQESALIWKQGFLSISGGGQFQRTDLRYENMHYTWWDLEQIRDQDRIVIFTHEWAMDDKVISRMVSSFKWFIQNGYHFIN